MKFTPKPIADEVNVSKVHPLVNFAYLLGGIVSVTLLAYVLLGLAVDWIVPRLSAEQEQRIGETLAPSVAPQLGGTAIEDDTRIAYIADLLEELRSPEDAMEIPFAVNLLDSSLVNAAALAGGQIFVTTAFLEQVESENELAFVLAHEIGHLSARDGLRSMGRSLVVLLGALVLNFGTSNTTGTPEVVTQTLNLNALDYSRTQEYRADVYGLEAVVRVYGHGAHSLEFFERLAQHEDRIPDNIMAVSEYFQTHPLTDKRIDRLEAVAEERGWSMVGERVPVPAGLGCANFQCDE